jgi:ABC-type transport system substrate-binding protein
MSQSYWSKRMLSRRAALRGAMAAGGGLAALSLVGCGGGDDDSDQGAATKPQEVLDPTKGVRGGKVVWQQYGDPGGGLEMFKTKNAGVHQMGTFTHDGLLEFRNGTPAFDGYDIGAQPNLAQAMPESLPDNLSYVFKLRQAKFHNGRQMTSEDVKYSFDRFAFGSDSAYKNDWVWLEKVEIPDPQTVVVKTKYPFADLPQSLAARNDADIHAKEHEESPEHEKKLMGTGAWLFVSYDPPVVGSKFKRNPEYHRQPYPYFDEIEFLGTSDPVKKIADFSTKQVHITYWFPAEEREQIKKTRPDAQIASYVGGGSAIFFRTDKAPFNDKRVRQALSKAMDRKAMIEAVAAGEGEPDQALSFSAKYWGFRKPQDLGAAADYWVHDPQKAKQMFQAAGITSPLEVTMPHWNATVIGQKFVDGATLIQTSWRNAGLVNSKDQELTFAQVAGTLNTGNYEHLYWGANTVAYQPAMGIILKNQLWSPPEGPKAAPTINVGYVSNARLNELLEKQLGQKVKEERVQSLRAIEEIMAEEQYRLGSHTATTNWFADPSIKNWQMPRDAYNGRVAGPHFWWFENGKAP